GARELAEEPRPGELASLAAVKARKRTSALVRSRFRLGFEQLVTRKSGRFEIEIRGGLTHLCLQLGDECGEIVSSVARTGLRNATKLFLLPLLALGARIGHPRNKPHLIDALKHAHGSNAVLAVVRPLQLATPVGFL